MKMKNQNSTITLSISTIKRITSIYFYLSEIHKDMLQARLGIESTRNNDLNTGRKILCDYSSNLIRSEIHIIQSAKK